MDENNCYMKHMRLWHFSLNKSTSQLRNYTMKVAHALLVYRTSSCMSFITIKTCKKNKFFTFLKCYYNFHMKLFHVFNTKIVF